MRKNPRKRTPLYKRPYNRYLYRLYVKKYLKQSYKYLQDRDYEKSSNCFEWIISYIIYHKINSSNIKFYEECKRRVESESERNNKPNK